MGVAWQSEKHTILGYLSIKSSLRNSKKVKCYNSYSLCGYDCFCLCDVAIFPVSSFLLLFTMPTFILDSCLPGPLPVIFFHAIVIERSNKAAKNET